LKWSGQRGGWGKWRVKERKGVEGQTYLNSSYWPNEIHAYVSMYICLFVYYICIQQNNNFSKGFVYKPDDISSFISFHGDYGNAFVVDNSDFILLYFL
jgi:hypothetical protein